MGDLAAAVDARFFPFNDIEHGTMDDLAAAVDAARSNGRSRCRG